jgi:DNA-binding PadR family transcriptional regulator
VTRTLFDRNISRRIREKVVKDSLEAVVLALVEDQPRTGYGIIASIFSSFDLLLSPGTVYPLLKFLESRGFIEGVSVGRARMFKLRESGRTLLMDLRLEYNEAQRLVSRVLGVKPKEKPIGLDERIRA